MNNAVSPAIAEIISGVMPDHSSHKGGEVSSTIDQVLIDLIDSIDPDEYSRNKRIVLAYLGLGGKCRLSMDQIGKPLGLTRERVRQILSIYFSAIEQNKERFIPYLSIIDQISTLMPSTASVVEELLKQRGLVTQNYCLDGFINLCEILDVPVPFRVTRNNKRRYVLPNETSIHLLSRLRKFVLKQVHTHGAVSRQDLIDNGLFSDKTEPDIITQLIESVLQDISCSFVWLTPDKQWLYVEATEKPNHVLREAKRIMALVDQLPLVDMYELVKSTFGNKKSEFISLPVFVQLLKTDPNYAIDVNQVKRIAPIDTSSLYEEDERIVLEMARNYQRGFTRKTFEGKCIALGVGKFRFDIILNYSPFFVRLERGLYIIITHFYSKSAQFTT